MKSRRDRAAKPKGELLSRIRGDRVAGPTLRAPGLTGQRPVLSFIMKTLAGDSRLVEEHLSFYLVWFEFGERGLNPQIDVLDIALDRNPALLAYAIDGMVETMRRLTDMWIDSGKSSSDPEWDAPAERNVEDVLPGQSGSLFEWIDSLLFARHPLYASLRRDGSMGIGDAVPRFSETHADRSLDDRLKEYGAKFAAYWFVKLLDSADARRIARCDACKRYFAYQRARLRTVKRGVFCPRPQCKTKASVKRTADSRGERLNTAATAWLGWTPRQHTEQRQWVADRVSDAHATTVGRRWVSQNLDEILKRAEALRNAKG
jgi:hypothetical protein